MRAVSGRPDPAVVEAAKGLLVPTGKSLPAWLLYDAEGSRLYERITALPEYYPFRRERQLLADHAAAIVEAASGGAPLAIAELGAGSAAKTGPLLRAALARNGGASYLATDISPSALEAAARGVREEAPGLPVRLLAGVHEEALAAVARLPAPRLVLFLGSSIGNYDEAEAVALLARVGESLGRGGALLLGTDLETDPALLVPAYDDPAGVTAAFNRNVLARLDRELGTRFEPAEFAHVASWNPSRSRMELYLESPRDRSVRVPALDATVRLAAGERIHTESCVKYDLPRVDSLLRAAGLVRARTFLDASGRFADHLAVRRR